jgi:hypothetical protein
MPAHSRPKDGVLSHAYVAGNYVFGISSKTWMAGTSPAMTRRGLPARLRLHNDDSGHVRMQ